MGRPASALELPVRRGINAAFTYVIAQIVLSIIGVATLLTGVFAGHGLLATTYVIRTFLSRGVPPTMRATFGLYRDGLSRHSKTGFVLSTILIVVGVLTSYDIAIVTGLIRGVPFLVASASLIILCFLFLLFPYFVVLFERTQSLSQSLREANVLFISNLRFSLLFAIVFGSVGVLSTLSVVGMVLIGYGFLVTVSVLTTDYLYKDMSGDRVIS